MGDTAVGAASRPKKPRDMARIVAWSATAAIGLTLAIAGVVYKPGADLATLCGSASFALQMGAVDYAREQVSHAAEKAPDDPAVRLLEARLAFVDDDLALATRHLDVVLKSEPDNGEAHLYYGFAAFAAKDWAASLEHYEKGAATLERTQRQDLITDLHIRLAELYLGAGRFREALHLGEQIVADNIRPAVGYLISAYSHLGLGDDTDFGQGLGRAYSSDPLDPLFRQSPGPLAKAFPWLPAP